MIKTHLKKWVFKLLKECFKSTMVKIYYQLSFIMRHNNRPLNQLRPITFSRHYTKHAEGSVLVCFGDTKVLCNVSIEAGVPRWLKGQGQGWLTAEYGMLPRATGVRTQ